MTTSSQTIHPRDLMIDEAGKVYVVEEQIDPASAPALVRAALEKRGSILKLESVQENGTTTYEGQVKTSAGKKVTPELDASAIPSRNDLNPAHPVLAPRESLFTE